MSPGAVVFRLTVAHTHEREKGKERTTTNQKTQGIVECGNEAGVVLLFIIKNTAVRKELGRVEAKTIRRFSELKKEIGAVAIAGCCLQHSSFAAPRIVLANAFGADDVYTLMPPPAGLAIANASKIAPNMKPSPLEALANRKAALTHSFQLL